jgi:hypothetical protein
MKEIQDLQNDIMKEIIQKMGSNMNYKTIELNIPIQYIEVNFSIDRNGVISYNKNEQYLLIL